MTTPPKHIVEGCRVVHCLTCQLGYFKFFPGLACMCCTKWAWRHIWQTKRCELPLAIRQKFQKSLDHRHCEQWVDSSSPISPRADDDDDAVRVAPRQYCQPFFGLRAGCSQRIGSKGSKQVLTSGFKTGDQFDLSDGEFFSNVSKFFIEAHDMKVAADSWVRSL